MKLLRVLLSLVVLAQLLLLGQPALAGAVSIESGTISKLEADVQSLGNLQFGKARAEISDNRLDIFFTVVDLTTGRLKEKKSLTGLILNCSTLGEENARTLSGGVYFDGGLSLPELNIPQPEYVKTTSGQKISGKITQVSRVQLSVVTTHGTEDFLISEIAEIHSPRYFQFFIPVADANGSSANFTGQAEQMSFAPATEIAETQIKPQPAVASEQPIVTEKQPATDTFDKHHMSKKAKIITIAVLGCVIATAIAVPIAVACGTSGGSNNRQKVLQTFAWQQFLSTPR